MTINKRFFPEVMPDNEIAYFAHLEGVINSVDELSTLEITRNPHSYHFQASTQSSYVYTYAFGGAIKTT